MTAIGSGAARSQTKSHSPRYQQGTDRTKNARLEIHRLLQRSIAACLVLQAGRRCCRLRAKRSFWRPALARLVRFAGKSRRWLWLTRMS